MNGQTNKCLYLYDGWDSMNSTRQPVQESCQRKMIWRRNSFSPTNASQREAKISYVELNSETPCPPRGAVPVNQGKTLEVVSLCSFRFAFGNRCDCPGYVRANEYSRPKDLSCRMKQTSSRFVTLVSRLSPATDPTKDLPPNVAARF